MIDQKEEPLVDSTKQESTTEVIKEETSISNTLSPFAETRKQASEIIEAAQVSKGESIVDPTKESETEVMKDKVSAAEVDPGPIAAGPANKNTNKNRARKTRKNKARDIVLRLTNSFEVTDLSAPVTNLREGLTFLFS